MNSKSIVISVVILLVFSQNLFAAPADLITQSHRMTIGDVGASEAFGGALYVTKADGSSFPDCSVAPLQVFAGTNDNTTSEGIKAIYAGLLTAKASGSEVSVWYGPGADGVCRIQILTIH